MSDLDRVGQMMSMYSNGASLRQVANEFGISHERVRQLFENRDPAFTAMVATKREQAKAVERAAVKQTREAERQRSKGTCRICGGDIFRPRAKYTCSPDHQEIWNKIKLHIDPKIRHDHIIALAKVIKAKESIYTNSQIKWATRVLSEDGSTFKPHAFVLKSESHNTFLKWKKEFGSNTKVPDSRA